MHYSQETQLARLLVDEIYKKNNRGLSSPDSEIQRLAAYDIVQAVATLQELDILEKANFFAAEELPDVVHSALRILSKQRWVEFTPNVDVAFGYVQRAQGR